MDFDVQLHCSAEHFLNNPTEQNDFNVELVLTSKKESRRI